MPMRIRSPACPISTGCGELLDESLAKRRPDQLVAVALIDLGRFRRDEAGGRRRRRRRDSHRDRQPAAPQCAGRGSGRAAAGRQVRPGDARRQRRGGVRGRADHARRDLPRHLGRSGGADQRQRRAGAWRRATATTARRPHASRRPCATRRQAARPRAHHAVLPRYGGRFRRAAVHQARAGARDGGALVRSPLSADRAGRRRRHRGGRSAAALEPSEPRLSSRRACSCRSQRRPA